jgi:nucleoside-diphosphate-sugar epimerase
VGDVKHSLASIERAGKELGYEPKADFDEGLQKTVAWYLSEHRKGQAVSA